MMDGDAGPLHYELYFLSRTRKRLELTLFRDISRYVMKTKNGGIYGAKPDWIESDEFSRAPTALPAGGQIKRHDEG